MAKNLRLLRGLVIVIVLGGLVVLASSLRGAPAVVVWVTALVVFFAAIILMIGADPTLRFDEATKQVFAHWQAAHPDRNWGWARQEIPEPRGRHSRPDPVLLGRITTNPPVVNEGRNDRVTFLGKTKVYGHDVLVMERAYYSSQQGYLQSRLTVVSVDTPGLVQPVCFYRRSGYQARGVYRSIAFWRFKTGDAEFDARFQVDVENSAAARRLLSPEITRFLCADPRAEHVGFSFEHGALSLWLTDKFDDVNAIPPMIDLMLDLCGRIPAQVWSEIG